MYHGKTTPELEQLSEEYYKMFGHFPSGHEELEYGKNDYKAYVKDTFGNSYDLNDKKNGILGDGSEILAVELYYITPDGYKYKRVHYRVSAQNNPNFYADQVDTLKASGMDGYAGDKYRFIDKFQAWIE